MLIPVPHRKNGCPSRVAHREFLIVIALEIDGEECSEPSTCEPSAFRGGSARESVVVFLRGLVLNTDRSNPRAVKRTV